MTPLENLLSRLDKVTETNNPRFAVSYKACCPAHGDNNPSLGIAQTDDGMILINCISRKCPPDDVLAAVGLEFGDLYDKPKFHRHKPTRKPLFNARDLLASVCLEILVTAIYAEDLLRGETPNDDDVERLKLAYQRVSSAHDAARGYR